MCQPLELAGCFLHARHMIQQSLAVGAEFNELDITNT
jgi:hypothetical protein